MIGAAFAAALFMGGTAMSATPEPMQWADLLARPKPHPQKTLFYGDGPSQFAELWLPDGGGEHPVVAMIHGGCWQAKIADRTYMNYAAEDLRKRGIAVWNIEYRSVDQKGGGYPGAFQDVASALDKLSVEAPHEKLSLKRLVVVGHSAGGQLALWSAARAHLPKSSVLHWAGPQPIAGVVDIAGIPDLKADTDTACGAKVLTQLVGPPTRAHPDVYADTSPAALLPLGVPVVVIHGARDDTVPASVGEAYVARARAAGDRVAFRLPPGGHVEEIAPGSDAWAQSVTAIKALLAGETPK